jgi:hypothetical protein
MNMRGKAIRLLLTITMLIALLPTTASASWGKNSKNGEACSQGDNHHCYALDEWYMNGGEQVEGTLAYQDTTTMYVPGWEGGDLVDNEEWAVFPNEGYWVEVGQTAGGNGFTNEPPNELFARNCCSLHSFYGWNNAGGFSDYAAPWTVAANEYHLYQISGQTHKGIWCPYFTETQAWCESGFPDYNKDLQVGGEYGANTKPENAAHEDTNGWWYDKEYNWLKESQYHDEGLCTSRYPYPTPQAGNINYGTC